MVPDKSAQYSHSRKAYEKEKEEGQDSEEAHIISLHILLARN